MWVRAARLICLALLGLLLTGCNITGTVDIRSADEVALDITVSDIGRDSRECDAWAPMPSTQVKVTAAGSDGCRIQGIVHPALLGQYVTVVQAGEYLEFRFNPLSAAPGAEPSGGDDYYGFKYMKADLLVTFPGQVLNSTGTIDGNRVRFTDGTQLNRAFGWQARALNHIGPEWAVVGPIVGVGAGLALAAVGLHLLRRARAAGAPTVATGTAPQPAAEPVETAEATKAQQSVLEHADSTKDAEATKPPADDSVWGPDPPAQVPRPRAPQDPAIWAPD